MTTFAAVSPSDTFKRLSSPQKKEILAKVSNEDLFHIAYDWYGWWARDQQQIPEGNWRIWLVLAGRGFGKTRTGSEWVRYKIETGQCRRIALIARTKADIRDVMIEGESGIMAVSNPLFKPHYEPSKRRLTWPNGAIATAFSADEPDQLRGPQHDGAWCDELAAWRRPETFDNLMLGNRLGTNPQVIVTTTPKRTELLRRIMRSPGVTQTGGTTYENLDNLAPGFRDTVIGMYEGTRLGQQELYAILSEDNPDALWQYSNIERYRRAYPGGEFMRRIVVGVDPEATSTEDSAETGIIVAGRGRDRHLYVLADYTVRGTPHVWGRAVRDAYHDWKADRVVGEVNNGGDMVGFVMETIDRTMPFTAVRASRGKQIRAEPISSLYEKGFAHHTGVFPELESQMTQWMPGEKSPDRMDALVWAGVELMLAGQIHTLVAAATDQRFLPPGRPETMPGFRPI